MDEGHAAAARARPGLFVHQAVAVGPAASQGVVEVGHLEAEVMDARPAPREEASDGAVGRLGHQKLDLRVAQWQRDHGGAVGRLGGPGGKAQHIAVEGQGSLEVGDRDPDVADSRGMIRHGASAKYLGERPSSVAPPTNANITSRSGTWQLPIS